MRPGASFYPRESYYPELGHFVCIYSMNGLVYITEMESVKSYERPKNFKDEGNEIVKAWTLHVNWRVHFNVPLVVKLNV